MNIATKTILLTVEPLVMQVTGNNYAAIYMYRLSVSPEFHHMRIIPGHFSGFLIKRKTCLVNAKFYSHTEI